MAKQTPEEKLLRIIENPAEGEKLKNANALKRKLQLNIFSAKGLKSLIFRISDSRPTSAASLLNLKVINKGLAVMAAAVMFYLIFDFVHEAPDMNRLQALASVAAAPAQKVKVPPEAPGVDIAEYASLIDTRDIFHALPVAKEEKPPQAKETLATLAKNLKLVGIIWSKNPQAMIEDKQENKTLLLNEGQKIGTVTLKQILRDKVILGFENEELELM